MTHYDRSDGIYLDPDNAADCIQLLSLRCDIEPELALLLADVLDLFPRPAWLYIVEGSYFTDQALLVDKFTFDMDEDALIVFDIDPFTLIDALMEMAIYLSGFSTLIGVENEWMVEFAIGSWKPLKNNLKRELGIPMLDEPLWIIALDEDSRATPEDREAFVRLFRQLDVISFTQMVRWAARDDVEIHFPPEADPAVISVYAHMKAEMNQVASGLGLEDTREFNHRLLETIYTLQEHYRPQYLPVPDWYWQALIEERLSVSDDPPPDSADEWNPFEAYIEELFDREDPFEGR